MIDRRNLFDQPIQNNLKTNDNIIKKAKGQCDDYTTGCLSDYQIIRLFGKILQINCNRFKQTAKTRHWSKKNTTNLILLEI